MVIEARDIRLDLHAIDAIVRTDSNTVIVLKTGVVLKAPLKEYDDLNHKFLYRHANEEKDATYRIFAEDYEEFRERNRYGEW
jgi:hypothetical protein